MADDSAPVSDNNARKTPSRGRTLLKWGVGLLLLALLTVAGAGGYAAWLFRHQGWPPQDIVLIVPKGSGLGASAALLERQGAIRDRRLFALGVRLYGADRALRAGEYRIPAGATMYGIMQQLREGRTVVHQLTVPEGFSVKQVLALLRGDPLLSGDIGAVPPEGSLLPETYHYDRGDARSAVLARMEKAMTDALAALWPQRARDLPFDTPEQAVVLASIVEKETALPEERPRIAAVFINRLRKGMKLQSDPTIIYGLTGGEPLGRPIRQSELDRETPYNTYHFAGLPPTPIANPGIDSIKAVLNPLDTDELYFVADGNGGHVFAKTYRQHQANVRKWRRIERQQK